MEMIDGIDLRVEIIEHTKQHHTDYLYRPCCLRTTTEHYEYAYKTARHDSHKMQQRKPIPQDPYSQGWDCPQYRSQTEWLSISWKRHKTTILVSCHLKIDS